VKYIVCVGDGMADYPIEEIGGKTPLQYAKTPNLDKIAAEGRSGLTKNIPRKMPAGSDVAILSILGYDPRKIYCGRAPLEAAAHDIDLREGQIALRCNLVTICDGIMIDYSAGHISTEEASELIVALNERIGIPGVKFYKGVSYRHLLIIDENEVNCNFKQLRCVPAHDIVNQHIEHNLPKGNGSDFLYDLMRKASEILKDHEINNVKLDLQENPANNIWLWGPGSKPKLDSFTDKYKITGGMISAVDLLRGIARLVGLNVINVPGITGFFDTNYEGKADYAIHSLLENDFVFVHVEAPDEAGHSGSLTEKIRAIENFDEKVVGRIMNKAPQFFPEWRIMVLSDHTTPISLRKHGMEPVPFSVMGTGIKPDKVTDFDEIAAKKGGYRTQDGCSLMSILFA
jgi:2,3-bisphosphoglycerate-independent phosphoglycerate mutase